MDELTGQRDDLARRLALAEDSAAAAGGSDDRLLAQLEELRR